MNDTAEAMAIQYEGPGVATELWGGTQANFLVSRHPHPAKEVAVLLNDAAARHLAAELGMEDGPAFRDGAARVAGRIAIQHMWDAHHRLDSLIMVSEGTLREDAAFMPELRAMLVSPVAAAERMAPQH